MRRKSMADVMKSITLQIPLIKEDLQSPVDYVVILARGRCLALEIVCHHLGFHNLDVELVALREQSYADEYRSKEMRKSQ